MSIDFTITFKRELNKSRSQFIGDSNTPKYSLFKFYVQKLQGFMGIDVKVMNIFQYQYVFTAQDFRVLVLISVLV